MVPSGINSPWYARIAEDPVNLISIFLGIIGVILGFIPLILWLFERSRSRILAQTVKEFSILERIQELQSETQKRNKVSEAKAQEIEKKAQAMREDVEQRIPNAAMAAYYQHTIPQLELEILDLGTRLVTMRSALNNIENTVDVVDPKVKKILSDQISANVGAKRILDQQQFLLVICTAVFSVVVSTLPYPLSTLAAIPLAALTLTLCYKLVGTARAAYPDNKALGAWVMGPRTLAITGLIIFAALLLVAVFVLLRFA